MHEYLCNHSPCQHLSGTPGSRLIGRRFICAINDADFDGGTPRVQLEPRLLDGDDDAWLSGGRGYRWLAFIGLCQGGIELQLKIVTAIKAGLVQHTAVYQVT